MFYKKLNQKYLLFFIVLLLMVNLFILSGWKSCNINDTKVKSEDLSEYFTGYQGCFIMYNSKTGEYIKYNREKCKKSISPCSTFKIVNSLIGLETKVVNDENTIFKW